jgi:hypothetical protein
MRTGRRQALSRAEAMSLLERLSAGQLHAGSMRKPLANGVSSATLAEIYQHVPVES